MFNIVCNLLAVAILKLFDTKAAGLEIGFWKTFLDLRLNYVVFFVVVNFLFVAVVTKIFPIIPLLKMFDDLRINSELGTNHFIQISWQFFCLGHNFTNLFYDREVGQGKVSNLSRVYLCMSVERPEIIIK